MDSGSTPRTTPRVPLTRSGFVVVAVGLLSFLGALIVGWLELFVVAAGCLLAVLFCVPFVVGRSRLQLERRLQPDRVTAGEPAAATLVAANTASVPANRRQVVDFIELNGRVRAESLDLPTLLPGAEHQQSYALPSSRRGVVKIGPARITKSDPFGLLQRDVGQTGVDTLWVLPRVVPCAAFASGVARDAEGPTFDTSPAGDVAFHTVRPYQRGDDARHVHWMATARTGEMMVRHYVDNRQPYLSVVLDTAPQSWERAEDPALAFDIGVEVAASLSISALQGRRPVSLHVGERSLVGRNHPASPQNVLEALTLTQPTPGFDLIAACPALIAAERETSVTVVVTGSRDLEEFLVPISIMSRSSHVVLVRVVADEEDGSATLGGARVLNVSSLDAFASLSTLVAGR